MISVIMPVWNGARFMDRAIASVVCQTSPNWELLIVDDGSTDDSMARAERWKDLVNTHLGKEKIRIFSTEIPHSGVQVGRNLAAKQARYNIFAYLDHDDLFSPNRIESLLPYFNRYDLVFSPYEIQEKEALRLYHPGSLWEKQSYPCSSEGERTPLFENWVQIALKVTNISVPLGVAHRRQCFDEVGGFQPGIIVGDDGILWRRMAERGARIAFCPVIAGRYIVRPDSQARTRKPFSISSFEMDVNHPLGSNGQYLDAEWFASLKKK
jgi:glycosyltransferase involved in cell wall biosynthesis